ncbi:hypothetical protein RchiOBHm_Chr7g0209401 [Rosa chinensis]|uniref:Uncharacterized protein n=1 Tax=Rosa chinensis TaxID=74649 RepID=A0A2P6PA06_ROSCH|nr:hypothetical protein RchiOBHm_Chr7g0209401 [Rosa chinensis]
MSTEMGGSMNGAVFVDAEEEELVLDVRVISDGGHWFNWVS